MNLVATVMSGGNSGTSWSKCKVRYHRPSNQRWVTQPLPWFNIEYSIFNVLCLSKTTCPAQSLVTCLSQRWFQVRHFLKYSMSVSVVYLALRAQTRSSFATRHIHMDNNADNHEDRLMKRTRTRTWKSCMPDLASDLGSSHPPPGLYSMHLQIPEYVLMDRSRVDLLLDGQVLPIHPWIF